MKGVRPGASVVRMEGTGLAGSWAGTVAGRAASDVVSGKVAAM